MPEFHPIGFQMIHNRSDSTIARLLRPEVCEAREGPVRRAGLFCFQTPALLSAHQPTAVAEDPREKGWMSSCWRIDHAARLLSENACPGCASSSRHSNERRQRDGSAVFSAGNSYHRELALKKRPRIRLAKPSLPLFSPRGSAAVKPAAMRPFGKGLDGCA